MIFPTRCQYPAPYRYPAQIYSRTAIPLKGWSTITGDLYPNWGAYSDAGSPAALPIAAVGLAGASAAVMSVRCGRRPVYIAFWLNF
jgi:hypothetical protein